MKIEALRKLAGKEEIDYSFLLSALRGYACPRDKISAWLKSGELIRIKKGLYLFGETVALRPYSKEVLANLIYGPSAVSLTYALSYYGLIPERVDTITSITNNRPKLFSTSRGDFRYYYLSPRKYAVGIVLNSTVNDQPFLIASPEKALCDQLHLIDRDYKFRHVDDVEKYLLHHLRVDETVLLKFKLKHIENIGDAYGDPRFCLLHQYVKNRKSS